MAYGGEQGTMSAFYLGQGHREICLREGAFTRGGNRVLLLRRTWRRRDLGASREHGEMGTQVLRHPAAVSSALPSQGRGSGQDAFRAAVHGCPQSPSPFPFHSLLLCDL